MNVVSRKEEILNVSAHLFYEKGFKAVSMRDIAQAMDIKAASLYNHITGKQQILSEIILEVAQKFTLGMASILSEKESAIQKLEKLIQLHIDITVNHAEAMAALNNDWMHLENDAMHTYILLRDGYEENFRSIIKEGIQTNEIKPNHPEVILFSILSTLRTLYLWNKKRGKLEVNILKRDMVEVLLKGII